MNSYYFRITCYKKKKLQWVVEMGNLDRVARFILASDHMRCLPSMVPECVVKIEKSYVSSKNDLSDLLMEATYDDIKALLQVALAA